ncbi:NAD(P)H-binding protein [Micromonospora ureilytica]|uniref:NmrA family NAD(P)-binding protein n=1 Tax=Micromonospora ureilytica TaxID=709868 RepID=UPI002E1197D5|nr:NAD(P)H-binding protein [Micromonospora ureilytica]
MADEAILVLGATGTTGRRVADRLRALSVRVRAASRNGPVRFDWSVESTWAPALAGASGVYLMAPDGQPVEPALVRLAIDQGVRHVVLLSSRAIEAMGDERLLTAERTVREAGADWTILRADWFDQNFDEGVFREAVLAGEIAVPVGAARQAFVDADDIAAVAVTALVEPGHDGQVYEVTGPRAITFAEAAETISRAAGRPVRHLGTADDYRAALGPLGVPAEEIEQQIAAFTALRDLGHAEPTDTVRRLTGRDPRDFSAYAAEAASRGAWRD